MKKTKLHLRRATIAQLTPAQLAKAGGGGTGESCAGTDCCAGGIRNTRNDADTNPLCIFTYYNCPPPSDGCTGTP
jgi:hypothetical protein